MNFFPLHNPKEDAMPPSRCPLSVTQGANAQ